MLSNINPRLRRTLLVLAAGTFGLYLTARSCFYSGSADESGLEQKANAEYMLTPEQYRSMVGHVVSGLPGHPEYADALANASMDFADSYSSKTRLRVWGKTVEQIEKHPELTDYLGPNAQQYMKRKAIRESAGKVMNNVYEGMKEGVKIIKGE